MADDARTTDSWPLGGYMRSGRRNAGLSIREAAKRAGISEGRWRQLESGYQMVRGNKIPIKSTRDTVLKVASVIDLMPEFALELAGFDAKVKLYGTPVWPVEKSTVMRRRKPDEPPGPVLVMKGKVSPSGIDAVKRRLELFGQAIKLMEQMTDDELWELSEIAQNEWHKREEERERAWAEEEAKREADEREADEADAYAEDYMRSQGYDHEQD